MQLKQKLTSLVNDLRALPKKYTIPAAVVIISGIWYIAAFVVEKPVAFSYAGETCVKRLTVLPQIHSTAVQADYEVQPSQVVTLGNWSIVAKALCFTPIQAPQPGVTKVSIAPFGGFIARQTFAITVPTPVVANTSVLDQPVPVSRPLDITLSGADTVFSYALAVDDEQALCTSKATTLTCDIETLDLVQNKPYTAELSRHFDDEIVATVVEKKIRTLSATAVTGASIKPNETVYAKPTEIKVAFDKKLVQADADIYKINGDKRNKLASSVELTKKGFILKLPKHLPRSASYELVTNEIEAVDGSSVVKPYKLPFKTSGGPKVTGVNVGSIGVAAGATIVISFDQVLSKEQDIRKFVALGGGASLIGKQGNQLLVSVNNVPKCGDFTITLTKDIQSSYGIAGHSSWSYSGRTVCHTIGTIGTSAQGRAITAYYFGDGATTVLYTGAIHGDEVSTKYLMDRWIQELEEKARDIPDHISVVVVPIVNPDGFALGSRTNVRNVDLNRNFATGDWQKDITTVNNQPFKGGGGKTAMSEPETKALAALAQRLQPKVILSYHSIGGMVAANQAGNSSALASTYARLSGYRNITGQSSTTFEYAISGTADDWYAEVLGVPSILVELGSHSYHQFERNQSAMWVMINS